MTDRDKTEKSALDKQFDALYKKMQRPRANAAFEAVLNATPEQLTLVARKSVASRNNKNK